jgi:RES domain-containing protein
VITAWRLIKARHAANAFNGEGARLEGGRWNPKGLPVVYFADHPALAALETFVHLKSAATKINFLMFRIQIPDEVSVLEVPVATLPTHWRDEPPTVGTMAFGEKWIREGKSAILKVPSVLIPAAANLILNPLHEDAGKVQINQGERFSFDPRMWK